MHLPVIAELTQFQIKLGFLVLSLCALGLVALLRQFYPGKKRPIAAALAGIAALLLLPGLLVMWRVIDNLGDWAIYCFVSGFVLLILSIYMLRHLHRHRIP